MLILENLEYTEKVLKKSNPTIKKQPSLMIRKQL